MSSSGNRCRSQGKREIPFHVFFSSILQHLPHCLQGKGTDIEVYANASIKGIVSVYGKNFLGIHARYIGIAEIDE